MKIKQLSKDSYLKLALYIGNLAFVFGNGAASILNYKLELSASVNVTIGIMCFVLGFLISSLVSMITIDDLALVAPSMFLCFLLVYGFYILAGREVKKNALKQEKTLVVSTELLC